jgi:hypothetical protein
MHLQMNKNCRNFNSWQETTWSITDYWIWHSLTKQWAMVSEAFKPNNTIICFTGSNSYIQCMCFCELPTDIIADGTSIHVTTL